MTRGLYLHHPSSLEHDTGDHPERAARIRAIEQELDGRGWLGLEPQLAPAADRAALEAVHPAAYVDRIAEVSARGGGMLDMDTVASAGSFEAALHAAGGGVSAVTALVAREAEIAFCGLRPPGHHAEAARAMGFCLFNNVAVAARYALDRLRRAARAGARLGRSPWQRDQRHLLRVLRGALCQHPPVPAVSGHGRVDGQRHGRGRGFHREPAGPAGIGPRGMARPGRACGVAGRA